MKRFSLLQKAKTTQKKTDYMCLFIYAVRAGYLYTIRNEILLVCVKDFEIGLVA